MVNSVTQHYYKAPFFDEINNASKEKILDEHQQAIRRWTPAKPTIVFETYWRFAVERQDIFFKRYHNKSAPWTDDPILKKYKFTNAYRSLDRASQYLIKYVIYEGLQDSKEILFRILLFKLFNRIETWELLLSELGEIRWSKYTFKEYDRILSEAQNNKRNLYSAAYIMPSGCSSFGDSKKHRNHLRLLEKMMQDKLDIRLMKAKTMQEAFELLKGYPTIGDFLAYQFITDINYSNLTDFSEMEFVIPGPGARNGIYKCFTDLGGLNEVELIKRIAVLQEQEFQCRNIKFKSLFGRPLKLIDCQNLFCEVDKYARIAHPNIKGIDNRKRIKRLFHPKIEPIEYFFPPKWEINMCINETE